MKEKMVVFFLAACVLAACGGDPRFDASSLEKTKESISRLKQALPESRRPQFDAAVRTMLQGGWHANGPASELTEISEEIRLNLDGKTAEQIIAEAPRVKDEREKREQDRERQELEGLDAKYKSFLDANDQLAHFRILSSRFYIRRDEMLGEKPVIEMKVKNETHYTVYSVYLECSLNGSGSASTDRKKLQYDIHGGLQPGQMSHWYLSPDAFFDWENAKIPRRPGLKISVVRIDGPDGNALYAAQELSEPEMKRLTELKLKYGKN
jgi:hypothetical protein